MHIHFITVEISIVGSTDRQVEPEGIVRKNSNPMTHHTHSMESRLSIEEDEISILKTSLSNHSVVNKLLYFIIFNLFNVYRFIIIS